MNCFYKFYCRAYQVIMRGASYFLPWRDAELITGAGSVAKLPAVLKKRGLTHALLVSDGGITKLGLHKPLMQAMADAQLGCTLYDKTVPNPTIDNVEEALALYKQSGCDCIIALGGGSAMDCAKGAGMRIARPEKTIEQLRGTLKVWKKLPTLTAIPTTAGTGSEVTLAAVITNAQTKDKFAVMDPQLMPPIVVLDADLTKGLPPKITSTTGMDALTHAVEAYIGHSNTKGTEEAAVKTVQLVFANLEEANAHGDNMEARENMQLAAYYGGKAFTRAYVGYVHAVAHSLGGFYGVPHGLANAVAMPYVLEKFGSACEERLAQLADCVKLTDAAKTNAEKAAAFIAHIRQMNKNMNIPDKIEAVKEEDIPQLVAHALKEGNPLYPVPTLWDADDFTEIYKSLIPAEEA